MVCVILNFSLALNVHFSNQVVIIWNIDSSNLATEVFAKC